MKNTCYLVEDATTDLVQWAQTVQAKAADQFEQAKQLVAELGAHYRDGYAQIGFWAPELVEQSIAADQWHLEVLTPITLVDWSAPQQSIRFKREQVPLAQVGDYVWGIVAGMTAGNRDQIGSFYWLRYQDADGNWQTIHDHLAHSVPFGTLAPAEFYDLDSMHADRADTHHFSDMDWDTDPTHQHDDGIPRVGAPVNILQIHPGTTASDGTLAGLRELYAGIAAKIRGGAELTPFEANFTAYDAVQLMPLEPPIEHEATPQFWEVTANAANELTVTIRQHDIINWGYDVMLSASPAVNPAILRTKRPDELVDLIAELHNFPNKPIKVIFDIVYGHTDNQAVTLFNPHYLAGPNMYGQNLSYNHPVVRATLLEMQKRKSNFGVDGIRVDGAQDFKVWDPKTQMLYHDDEYLREMNDIVQTVAGVRYRPWMIFEDGRPWPRDDWELASTYREVTRQFPNVWQWGPLTFAHNTPFLFTFWVNKSWRVRELIEFGKYWITGCANHDTLRRGTQVRLDARVNARLGETLPEIIRNAYDNPASRLFDYAMMPGIPMDFVQGLVRAPWSFIRNTDDRYGVKVVSEESRFLYWSVWEDRYNQPDAFVRLKARGFTDLESTRYFFTMLDHLVQATHYDLDQIVQLMNAHEPKLAGPKLTVPILKQIALAWMEDVFDYCHVTRYAADVDPERSAFNLAAREFRRERPWLMENLRHDESFDIRQPANGTAFFYGLRRSPDNSEQVLFAANMEGEPVTFVPAALPLAGLPTDDWTLALQAPRMLVKDADQPLTLQDSQAVVFVRRSP